MDVVKPAPASSGRLNILLCAAGIAVNMLILGPRMFFPTPIFSGRFSAVNDFRHFYTGATLARNPYDRALALRTQERLFEQVDASIGLNRLPFYYSFISPIAKLTTYSAHVVWLTSLFLAAIAAVIVWPMDRLRLAAAFCFSRPLVTGLIMEQDLAFVLLALALAERSRLSGMKFRAGLLFSLTLIKWHFVIFLPVMLLIRREYRLFAGMAAGTAALVGISFADAGPSWPIAYLNFLRGELKFGTPDEAITLHSIALHFETGASIEILASIVVTVVVLTICWRAKSFELAVASALLGGLLLSRRACVWDCSVLLLSLTLLSKRDGFLGVVALMLLVPPIYLLAKAESAWMIGIGLVILLLAMLIEALRDLTQPKRLAQAKAGILDNILLPADA
jgi:hypothetical protein